jgi:prolyl oligopeptidase
MYGYGGFGNPQHPQASAVHEAWMDAGGIVAIPCLRGGGELGEHWHREAWITKKQNTFNDAIAAAQWLKDNRIVTEGGLGVTGGSNGGLLVGALLTQRPDLFSAGVASNAVLDVLRSQLMGSGRGWIYEYGDAREPEAFAAMRAYSPVHNVRRGQRVSPLLIQSGNRDDRVPSAHSYKFLAALQNNAVGGPFLFRKIVDAGHVNVLQADRQDADAEKLMFLAWHLGLSVYGLPL